MDVFFGFIVFIIVLGAPVFFIYYIVKAFKKSKSNNKAVALENIKLNEIAIREQEFELKKKRVTEDILESLKTPIKVTIGSETNTAEQNDEKKDESPTNETIAIILLLNYIIRQPSGGSFPDYWATNYNFNPKNTFKIAAEKDYFRKATDFEMLDYLGVKELKDILRENKLKLGGNKEELIERIKDTLTEDDISGYIKTRVYVLTEKGQALINENKHIIYYDRSSTIKSFCSVNEYDREVKKGKEDNYYDTAIRILNEKGKKELEKKEWWDYRYTLVSIVSIALEGNINKRATLYYLLMSAVLEITLRSLNQYVTLKSEPTLSSYTRSNIVMIKNELDITDDEIFELFASAYDELGLPKEGINKEQAITIFKKFYNDYGIPDIE